MTTAAGKFRADEIAARIPQRAWQRLSAGRGSQGQRFYGWAWTSIDTDGGHAGRRWLLVRRNNDLRPT